MEGLPRRQVEAHHLLADQLVQLQRVDLPGCVTQRIGAQPRTIGDRVEHGQTDGAEVVDRIIGPDAFDLGEHAAEHRVRREVEQLLAPRDVPVDARDTAAQACGESAEGQSLHTGLVEYRHGSRQHRFEGVGGASTRSRASRPRGRLGWLRGRRHGSIPPHRRAGSGSGLRVLEHCSIVSNGVRYRTPFDRRSEASMSTATAPARTYMSMKAAWIPLAALCLAFFVEMVDNTLLSIALPTIGRDLGGDTTSLQWITGAYSLTFGGLLLTAGSIADRFGRRRVLQIGL